MALVKQYKISNVHLHIQVDLMVLAVLLLGEGELLDPSVGTSLGPLQAENLI